MDIDAKTIGKGVLITTIALVILHFIKPHLPATVTELLA